MKLSKRDLEKEIFRRASPLLELLYGKFECDESQTDKPDFAIDILKPKKSLGRLKKLRIGIEITTVDDEEFLAYTNDKRFGAEAIRKHQTAILSGESEDIRPEKDMAVTISSNYIYDGIFKKLENHKKYGHLGDFDELIIVCFSEMLSLNETLFTDHLNEYTNYLLSSTNFPFDKVIFVSLRGGDPVRIYDKKKKLLSTSIIPSSELVKRHSPQIIIPIGKTVNLRDAFKKSPVAPPRAKRT